MTELNVEDPPKVAYCIPLELRDQQIKINIAKVPGRVQGVDEVIEEPIAIVCYGPSLKDTWEQLRDFKTIMTCSGAHKFLIEKGIIPTFHVDLEPRAHKIGMLGAPHKDVQYLIASTIHPTYLDALDGYNVKLWHIFATDDEGTRMIPRGEEAITGGSSVGLRCMTLARFIGYTNLHVFGMDGNIRGEQSHTESHPNKPPGDKYETNYEGVKYQTTPSMLWCAKETFKELNQMPDVKAVFYGDGLVQHMAKNYKPFPKESLIAMTRPEVISKEYIDLNKKLHQTNPNYGMGGGKHAETILKLSQQFKTTSILDYGAGKGMLAKALPFPIWQYDPAIPELSDSPRPAEIVACTDVLEHIEPDKLAFVLDDLRRVTKQVGYFVISTRAAVKTYSNGKNTHLIVKDKDWWEKKLKKYFDIGTIIANDKQELHVVVGPKKDPILETTSVDINGLQMLFHTPNDLTRWRCQTLLTKEPVTIDWLHSMKEGDVMVDVGANMGAYSIIAAKRGVRVFAFEPEANNFSVLQKNIQLNKLDNLTAYPVAINDSFKIGKLYVAQNIPGGSGHSFGIGKGTAQGCIGVRLDDMNMEVDHIKIDVDGNEPNVIEGAIKTLEKVKTVLVEINAKNPRHKEAIEKLEKLGFSFDPDQVEKSTRKEGPFKGVAEYLFSRVSPMERHISKAIENAVLVTEPFRYLYVENVFPEKVYQEMIDNLPHKYVEIEKTRGAKGYPKRFTSSPTGKGWEKFWRQMFAGELKRAICKKFGIENSALTQDLVLIRDEPGYSIPPHTDSLKKVISALFYLPKDESILDEGTSIFAPKKEGFTCEKGLHYTFEEFTKVWSAPFKPNSVLIFQRTDNSFHGVEPTKSVRDVLLYNLNHI